MPRIILHAALAFFVALAAGFGHPARAGELDPHDPELERQSFKLLPGFEANLFAAEPMLANPIHMTWDPEGRLWVACSWAYPQLTPGEEPNDKIIVLEDTDGDGRADKSTVFAEGLYVPTGLELGDGGVYVANAPDLLFLKDTDGDLKADVRRVMLTGFATEDNHHSISAWRWGPGGWLYFQEGTFMHSQVETPHGVVRLRYGGVFQYRPRTGRLRVFADYRASNPWGHMFDRWGQSVLIDNPRLYFLAPLTANSRAKLGFEPSGSGTKQCGGEFVSGRHLPEEYRGEIWTNQYKTHTVARYRVTDDGAGFAIKGQEPLIVSSSENFRPVDLKIGPDGAVYILDWYNPLIGHMQHSFRDPRRDKSHGRVWRVTYKDRPLVERPRLRGVPPAELLDHLKAPEDWTRYQVRRVLYDMDPAETSAALDQWVARIDPREAGFEHHRLEALWCYQTIGVVNEELLKAVLGSGDGRARAAAVRVVRYWQDELSDPLALLSKAVGDEHPRVRLEAVLSAGYVPDARSVTVACRALDKPMDRYLEHALKLTVDGLSEHWLPAYRAGELRFDAEGHRDYALSNLLSDEAIRTLLTMLNSGRIDPQRIEGPAEAIARSANARQLEPVVFALAELTRNDSTVAPRVVVLILDALERAARERKVKPRGNLTLMIRRAYGFPADSVRVATTRLVGAWKIAGEAGRLKRFVNASDADPALRRAAAVALGEIGGKAEVAFLEELLDAGNTVERRYLGVIGLAAADLKLGAEAAGTVLAVEPGEADPVPVVAAFLERKGGADRLAAALSGRKPHPEVARRVMFHLDRLGYQHEALVAALVARPEGPSLEERLLAEDAKKLAADAREHGDAERGELIFHRRSLNCTACHGFANAGPKIGPDLAAIGSSNPPDYVVDSLLRPSKVIKEFYESATVVTADGRVVTGRLAFKGEDRLVLYDVARQGEEVTLPGDQIDALVENKRSLMPARLVNKLISRQEFLDLVRFLTALGRPGPYATTTSPLIRRWRVKHVAGDAGALDRAAWRDDASWQRAYSTAGGELLAPAIHDPEKTALVRAHLDVASAGSVRLQLNSEAGLGLYVDDRRVEVSRPLDLKLSAGRHALTFVIDPGRRGEVPLRVEVLDGPESPAAYQIVAGP